MLTYKYILGIDPGLAGTGWGLIENDRAKGKQTMVDYGVISTSPKTDFIDRLNIISKELTKIIKNKKPDVVAVEKLFFNKNVKSALEVGHARGVILLTASQNKIPVREFTPSEIKQSLTGHGAADKQQVMTMTKCMLSMQSEPKPDHAADALATACTAASFLNSKLHEVS
ncbi:crossover junction endodeoxyribonuclease RuvC [Patescibacteria group bacterium]|nr:crossover junction endodeoxyribonuclease RuvC [Patescibacteria group bacterium]MBU1673679.1 crossover junction endodeoxyribonuclease RuvC [Patescibacteria group bacterium]MBU1963489.1 crossover junction endodeoxyribonuclease RuvC [Patescibacteria group bacterium]